MGNISRFFILLISFLTIVSLNISGFASQHELLNEPQDPQSQYKLGDKYYIGELVPKDDILADYWYEKAAEQGYALAQYRIGLKYLEGRNVAKDPLKALEWFKKSESQDCAAATHELGKMYFNGIGVDEDIKKGLRLIKRSAKKNDYNAQMTLMLIYGEGTKGVVQDLDKAEKWLNKAKGGLYYAQAMKKLNGGGALRNIEPVIAESIIALLAQAAEFGHEEAKIIFDSYSNYLNTKAKVEK